MVGQFGANDYRNMLMNSNMTLEQARSFVPEIVSTVATGVEVLDELALHLHRALSDGLDACIIRRG